MIQSEIDRPSVLQMVFDEGAFIHMTEMEWWLHPEQLRLNVCFADGHARFTRQVNVALPQEQIPWAWNSWNPAHPVELGKPCSPTCVKEAAQ